ncbi:MAG TPA: hypothetical protein VGT41_05775 [Candidatus Babeliales bacterium]|nr:hypothetical protein [Candidatus Babeliales bacterium]
MKYIYIVSLWLLTFSDILPGAQNVESVTLKSKELGECLENIWRVDHCTTNYLLKLFGFLLENPNNHPIIDDFIIQSKNLNLDFSSYRPLSPLSNEDGVFQAPKQHLVVFENPWIRILWGSSQPGECEKLHTHTWKSLMVIVEPTTYEIIYAHGIVEKGYWPRGVYVLDVEAPYSCTNVGDTADVCLRFEIKE